MKGENRKKIPSYIYQKAQTQEDQATPETTKKKRKLQNTNKQDGTRFMDTLTLDAEADESNNGTETIAGDKEPNDHTKTVGNELNFTTTMTLDEVNDHIQKCLEMSSENKITPKNAFALQLIDCMKLLLKKEDFSVMACTLDAGQKIYAHRIDGLHQQVVKLAEEVINNQKNRKTTEGEVGDECDLTQRRDTRKLCKRNILATRESLRRTLKSKDPKDKFIKIAGLPGAIMSSVRRDPKDFSFSLENSVRFWNDWENYKPLKLIGSVNIPHCEIYRDKHETSNKENLPRVTPIEETEQLMNNLSLTSPEVLSDDIIVDDLIDEGGSDDNKSDEGEVEIISTAIQRLNDEAEENNDICNVPSRSETMKIIFNKASEYHYLNMDKAYYWAGPGFWKRPKIASSDCKEKKKITRKKKDPNVISYTGPEVEEKLSKFMIKGPPLSAKTIRGWKMKSVTYPTDLKIGAEHIVDLFHMPGYFKFEENPEPCEMEASRIKSEPNCDSDDMFQGDAITDSCNSQDPLNSSFYENAPENSSSPDCRDPLNSAFYDVGLVNMPDSTLTDTGKMQPKIVKVQFSSSQDMNASLIPVPKKIVDFQPIKYKTKPVKVDMQHLKQTMWEVINEENDTNEPSKMENSSGGEYSSGTKFSNVLKQLVPRLEQSTAEDLSPGMALLSLLTLANEKNLHLKNADDFSDVAISLEDLNLAKNNEQYC